MISQQTEEKPPKIEARVAILETELAEMKRILSSFIEQKNPWWQKVAGSCENDPTFDAVLELGKEWRNSVK